MGINGKTRCSQQQFYRFMRTQLLVRFIGIYVLYQMLDEHGFTTNGVFTELDNQLRQVFKAKFGDKNAPSFGDISMICFGDHLQLPPVKCSLKVIRFNLINF